MLSDRPMAELRVESRNAGDLGGRDFRLLANPLDRLARQIAIMPLNRLQQGNHRLPPVAQAGDDLIDELQIELGHICRVGQGSEQDPPFISFYLGGTALCMIHLSYYPRWF